MLHLSITLCLCYFLTVTVTVAELENQLSLANFFSNQYINEINSIQQFWKAGRNFDPDTTLEDVRNLLGELDSEVPEKSKIKNSDHEWPSVDEIPETFDARTHWRKECPRISEVLDQGHCGSCWAVSSSSAATDRHCIKSKGKLQIRLSANHITACCHHCGHACFGGKTRLAWDFYHTHGLITGGSYNSSEGCQPYSIESCEHGGSGSTSSTLPSCSSLPKEDPVCSTKCTNKGYRIPFKRDRHKNKDSYVIMGAETIQKDILAHGPMVVSFKTYSDFPHYKSGVYVKTSRASRIGNHAVKVIGWGKDKINGRDLPYWLIMNSWNEQWGDKGLFKILRGSNHCGVEERATGGVPRHYYKT